MTSLILTLAGIGSGLIATLMDHHWLAGISAAVAAFGAFWQHREGLPYEHTFTQTDWQPAGNGTLRMTILKTTHKKKSPTVFVFEGISPKFETVTLNDSIDQDGAVVLGATEAFNGKVVIK